MQSTAKTKSNTALSDIEVCRPLKPSFRNHQELLDFFHKALAPPYLTMVPQSECKEKPFERGLLDHIVSIHSMVAREP